MDGQKRDSQPAAYEMASQRRPLRVPTVNEALPYSPFTSVVPFNADLITPPLAISYTAPTAFSNSLDIETTRTELERLSAGASRAEDASKRCQQTLQDVQKLLHGKGLTEFKFKHVKRLQHDSPGDAKKPKLSPFAKMVFDTTNVQYRYPSPPEDGEQYQVAESNRNTPQSIGQASAPPNKAPSTTKKLVPIQVHLPQPLSVARASQQPSSHSRPALSTPTPSQNAPSEPTSKLWVKPVTMTPQQLGEYQKITVRDITPTMSKNKSAYLTNGIRVASVEQRRKGDVAVGDLQNLLLEIFEAEDQMQPDTSGDVSMHDNGIFTTSDTMESAVPVLQTDAQLRLDSAVHKVFNAKRIGDVEVEHLVRAQKLCDSSLSNSESWSLHIGEDWAENDIRDWLDRLSIAQKGLIAARTTMEIMTGRCDHKELQSEDYLRQVLDAMRTVVERCIIPIVEERSTVGEKAKGEKLPRNSKFDLAVENRPQLQGLLQATKQCMKILGDLLVANDIDESLISSIEALCKLLIFAENSSNDKESALGTGVFELLRVDATDVLAKIFTKYENQRSYIFDEILTSLEKLPATKQSARQFKVDGSKTIQLVSALLMRLIQTSATFSDHTPQSKSNPLDEESSDEEDDSEIEDSEEAESDDSEASRMSAKKNKRKSNARKGNHNLGAGSLPSVLKPLQTGAQNHASYIIKTLLHRTLTSSRSEEPFRKLLDIFTADFLTVLGSLDWPAAEILLRTLVIRLVSMAEDQKSPAPSRTLALELLGTIGSGILDVQEHTIRAANALTGEDLVSVHLTDMAKRVEDGDLSTSVVTGFEGPFRVVLEYIHARGFEKDPQLQATRGYYLMQWADTVCNSREAGIEDHAGASPSSTKDLQLKIKHMIEDVQWLEEHTDYAQPNRPQGQLAAKIVASNSKLCKAFARIFDVILKSMRSEQPTVRSRSLKSVTTLLEKDPSVLDRNRQILQQMFRCLRDPSSLVRDSALLLIQKCVALRPALELKVYEQVIPRTNDMSVAVRKRAMAFLKQIYLRNSDNKVRAAISNALIARIKDIDESVAEAARSTVEEIWFTSLRGSRTQDDRSVDARLHLRSHAALVIQTVELGDNVAAVLESLIKTLLTQSKQAADNVRTSKLIVATLFDGIINQDDIPGRPTQAALLQALTVFAKAAPKMFLASQLEVLEPYTKNLTNSDDLDVYHHAVTILRYTMPVLTDFAPDFLSKLQRALLSSVQKLPKSELMVVAPCLWTIETVLGGSKDLTRLFRLAFDQVYNFRGHDLVQNNLEGKASKLITIIGQLGKACNFDKHLEAFQKDFSYKGKDVAGLLVETICNFTSPKQPQSVREAAIAAVCDICQSSPEHFLRADVVNAIETVFKDQNRDLESVMLVNLEEFFAIDDTTADEQEILGAGVETGTQRLGNTYQATGYDTASASLSQRFLPDFLRIALASMDDVALSAARIVVYINTRGMAHPGDSGPSLVALETCPNTAIAKLAFMAHKEQYMKHENVFEKGLVKAVQQAFDYQQKVVQSTTGFTGNPPSSKLHFFWEVLKQGKPKVRTKLFTTICASMDFDPVKLKLAGTPPQHLLYVRFCVESIALFEFDRLEDPLHLLGCLEKIFAGTGTSVAQAIESEVLQLQVPIASQVQAADEAAVMETAPATASIDPNRLRQLSVSAQILLLLWETRTFLRRAWNLQKHVGKPKKDKKGGDNQQKNATRSTNAASLTESYQEKVGRIMGADDSEAAQRKTCNEFVQVHSVDTEVKVGSEEDAEGEVEDDGDDARSENSSAKASSATPRGKKRKSVDGGAGGPPKKRGRPRKSSNAKRMDSDDDDADGDWE